MPELPDVEGFRLALTPVLPQRRVEHVQVVDTGVLRGVGPRSFARRLVGRTFAVPRRVGKWLLLPTDGPILVVHSGMTGHPYRAAAGEAPQRFDRVVLQLSDSEFRFADQRKLRGLWLADSTDELERILGELGPDALDLPTPQLREALGGLRRTLKAALMDQAVVAGLGNLLTDEIAWQARIAPTRPCLDLNHGDISVLGTALRRVLRTSVRHRCVPGLRTWLTGVRDDPEPHCPRCGTALRRHRVAGRGAIWCPRCQPW